MVSQLRHSGSADRGLYRVHQFSKVEMFVVSTPEKSEAILEELCLIEEEIFQELGLHYKVLVSRLRYQIHPHVTIIRIPTCKTTLSCLEVSSKVRKVKGCQRLDKHIRQLLK